MSYGSRHLGMINPSLSMGYDTIPRGVNGATNLVRESRALLLEW